MNHYALSPTTNYCLCVSGGRSSGYLLKQIIAANNGLPLNAVCVFNNTGKEREETLIFVDAMSREWGIPITWLEYWYDTKAKGVRGIPKQKHKVVTFQTASRNGEPFAAMIENKRRLPSVTRRICTAELKVLTSERYLKRELGWQSWRDVIGIRRDEYHRAERMMAARCTIDMPMFWAKVTKKNVQNYWRKNNFDLGIDSTLGNCDACFLKGRSNLLHTFRKEPERAIWWSNMERLVNYRQVSAENINWFRKDFSMSQLLDMAQRQGDLFDGIDDAKVDCFCGD